MNALFLIAVLLVSQVSIGQAVDSDWIAADEVTEGSWLAVAIDEPREASVAPVVRQQARRQPVVRRGFGLFQRLRSWRRR